MKLLNYQFKSKKDLETFVDKNILNTDSILIQIFSGDLNVKNIQDIISFLKFKLPYANIIGASTAGEIVNGIMKDNTITISFSMFEKTKLRLSYYLKKDFQTGRDVASSFLKSNTKAIIAFSEALKNDVEPFLAGFKSIQHNIPIAGGNAGDNYEFKKTFIIYEDKIYFEGIVLCALDGNSLNVHTNYSLEWSPVGKEMIITKADGNIIYEIDYTPIEEIYKYYLGDKITDDFPLSVIEFPLVKTEDNITVARSIIGKDKKNGYIYAGHFNNADKVRFAIGDIENVLDRSYKLYENIKAFPIEAIFIYSCSVRKMFIKEQLNYEFALIGQIASTTGFFTYGEFYHSQTKNQLLNITTTTLSLSESNIINKKEKLPIKKHNRTMLNSLVHLVNISHKVLSQYKELLDNSSIVSKTDVKGYITYVNDEFCKVSGYSREELIGKKHNIIKHPQMDKAVFRDIWRTITSKKVWRGNIKNLAKDGSTCYVKSVIMPILNDDGEIVEYIAARTNVTELVKKDEIIKKQYKDILTGLQNRSSLNHKLTVLSNKKVSLILINIDRFSDINEYFGYEQGDKVLHEFAKKLQKRYSEVFRISGDEFAILCEHSLDELSRKNIIKTIAELESEEYQLLDDKFSLFLSCGVAYGKKDEIYKYAHIALKQSKVSNEQIVFYNDNEYLSKQIEDNIKVISMIKFGITEDRFIPFFQGIVDNKTKKIVKYECLIRLKENNGNIISPFFFLEHAKKAKLYTKLTKIMIRKSFEKFANENYEFSINLSLQDIESTKVVKMLIDYLKRYKCGSRVVLEIVESEGIENFSELHIFIKQVKEYGCKIAIDDFGTGYSNFGYLAKLNIDYIKIDGSLIKNIDKSEIELATVESILYFAKKMNIQTIAEFVESKKIYKVLNRLGVDFSQGYYFGKPEEDIRK